MKTKFWILFVIIALLSCNKEQSSTSKEEALKEQLTDQSSESENEVQEKWVAPVRKTKADNPLETEIFQWQDSIYKATYEEKLNIKAMQNAIDKMKEHGLKYKNHPRSSSYLLRAGDYAQGLRNFDEALEILDIIIQDYDDSYEYADAIYYTAYIYDRQLSKYDEAAKYYNRFLNEMPTNELAEQVKVHLNRINKLREND
jgi:tetratricopeptide (TPR) repeat protein